MIMKKQLLFVSGLLLTTAATSQITINSADILEPLEYIERAYDFNPSIAHSPAGANQTWNFGTLLNNDDSEIFGFVGAGMADGFQYFPDATMATVDAQNGFNAFIRKNNDAVDILGVYADFIGSGTSSPVYLNPHDRVIQFPATFGSTYNSNYSASLTFPDGSGSFDSIRVDIDVVKTSEMDAWGELTTPFGTYSVLRQYVNEITTTTITGYTFGFGLPLDEQVDESHAYSYWSNSPTSKFVLLEYTYDPITDEISDVIWQRSSPVLSVDEAQITAEVAVYPNPASEVLNIRHNLTNEAYAIIDAAGRVVLNGTLTIGDEVIDLSKLNDGVYHLRISAKQGNEEVVKKVVVKK
jgi:hypothetical protein